MAILNRHLYPPQGWAMTLPDGRTLKAGTFEGLSVLLSKVLDLPYHKAESAVEEWVCATYPSMCSEDASRAKPPMTTSLSDRASAWLDRRLSRNLKPLFGLDDAETEKRIKVCKDCPMLEQGIPSCCGGGTAMQQLIKAVADKYGISFERATNDHYCNVFGHPNRLAAMEKDGDPVSESDTAFHHAPDFCWHKQK